MYSILDMEVSEYLQVVGHLLLVLTAIQASTIPLGPK